MSGSRGMYATRGAGLLDRLQFRTAIDDVSGCWLWTGAKHPTGYGHIKVKGRVVQVHRAAYELLVGPVPQGLVLDHLCRTPACWNPDHLEPVTRKVNAERGLRGVLTTRCRRGHAYTLANTYIDRATNARVCRTCNRSAVRRYLRRKAAVR